MRGTLHAMMAVAMLLGMGAGCNDTAAKSLTLAATTSTRDTGLLDELLRIFEARTGVRVRVVVVGSGQALELARRGDLDVIFTHDPPSEERFVAEGFGTIRTQVMTNEFVLVGPASDPAQVLSARSGVEAFQRVAQRRALFISRGDESGTHQMEKATWAAAGLEPGGPWYIRSGLGMAAMLRMADEKRGYALADRGTFLAQRGQLSLAQVFAGDPAWINRYAVIPVNPRKHPHVKHDLAKQFAEFLISDEVQRRIAEFGREKFGEPLFRPIHWPERAGT